MEKRLLSFLVAMTLVMTGWMMLRNAVIGPPPVREVAEAEAALNENTDDDEVSDRVVEDKRDSTGASSPESPAETPSSSDVGAADSSSADPDPEPLTVPKRMSTFGSLDPASGYRMLVYWSNRGAAIDRVEFSSPKYQDLENRAGYLGYLALTDAKEGGVRVNVVGPGTPASLAESSNSDDGLRGPTFQPDGMSITAAGDRITALDGNPVENRIQFHRALSRTKPGQELKLTVFRPAADGKERKLQYRTQLTKAPLAVVATEPTLPTESDSRHPSSYLLTLDRIGEQVTRFNQDELKGLPSLHKANWSATARPDGVEFKHTLSAVDLEKVGETGELEIVKRFRLSKGPATESRDPNDEAHTYLIDFDIQLRNLGDQPLQLGYQLDGPTGMTTEGWWYSYKVHPSRFVGAGARDIMWRAQGDKHELVTCSQVTKHARKAKENEENPDSPLFAEADPEPMQYIGCDTQYFASVLQVAAGGDLSAADLTSAVARPVGPLDKKMKRTDVTYRIKSKALKLPPGGEVTHSFSVFTGPKDAGILSQFGLQDCIVYGWFGAVSKPMLSLLHGLYWVTGKFSYGIAIILLTLMVRACMFPLGRRMAQNAQKMQELAPEMKKITDKYKNDMEKRAQAQRELFAKHKYNPFSGCLVMFIQMPIFLGLYRGLSCDIALRQAPLIPGLSWCSNLAGPDKFWNWQGVVPDFMTNPYGLFGLGPFLNVLPLITVGLFLMQHKLFTPPPQDEQQKMQHSVMKFMMLFMGILFHKVAAGLCLYLITSTVWGLAERTMLPKPKPPGTSDGDGGGGGGMSLMPKPKTPSAGRNGSSSNGTASKRKKRKKSKR